MMEKICEILKLCCFKKKYKKEDEEYSDSLDSLLSDRSDSSYNDDYVVVDLKQ